MVKASRRALSRIFFFENLTCLIYSSVYIGQFSQFALKFKEKKFFSENWNIIFWVGPFFQGRSGKGKQIKF